MIDYFALSLTHGLIVLALWRVLQSSELDVEPRPEDTAETGSDA